MDSAEGGGAYARVHSEVEVACGTAADKGASEKCDTDVVYLKDHPDDGAQEESPKPEAEVWSSPDITVMNKTATPLTLSGDRLAQAFTGPSGMYDEPSWDKPSEVWVRIRSRAGSLALGEKVTVRVYQARPHTSFEFPRDFEVIAPAHDGQPGSDYVLPPVQVNWGQQGTGYRLVGTGAVNGEDISVYAFDWTPSSALRVLTGESQHSCIRAELSTPKDPRPPFFTHVRRSNNIAQRNININAQPLQVSTFAVWMSPKPSTQSLGSAPAETRTVRVYWSSRDLRRKAYFYVPPHPGAVFVDNGQQSIPASAVLLTNGDDKLIQVQVPPERRLMGQVIIDSRQALPPHPADHFWVNDGLGQVRTYLVPTKESAHANSAEWGLLPGWTATGAWRTPDTATEACAGARTGRRAFVFNQSATCTYEGAQAGALTAPAAVLPCGRSRTTLSFWHWSQTERSAGYDKRQVRISVDGGAWQTVWDAGAQDFGGRGDWRQEQIDLTAHRGRSVQVQFFFDPVDAAYNNYAGWYVDDIEVK